MKELSIVYNGADFTTRYERKDVDRMSDYQVYFDDLKLTDLLGSPFEFSFDQRYNKNPLFEGVASASAYHIAASILKADGFENV